MILLNDLRLAIVTPPKCASTALHDAVRHLPAELRVWPVLGPSLDGRIDHHTRGIPPGCVGYKIVAVVRHPLCRLVSLYQHLCTWQSCRGLASPSFQRFSALVAHQRMGDDFYEATLNQWLAGLKLSHVLHVESVDAELRALGLPFPQLPKANASHRLPWPAYFERPELLEAVKPWALPDFELGEYEWPQATASQEG
jgi:hypothetical protein